MYANEGLLEYKDKITFIGKSGEEIDEPNDRGNSRLFTKDLDRLLNTVRERNSFGPIIFKKIDEAFKLKEEADRLQMGRYTAQKAAELIATNRTNPQSILDKLEKAARNNVLPCYFNTHLERSSCYPPYASNPDPYCFTWTDLNSWLEQNEPELFKRFQFSNPNSIKSVDNQSCQINDQTENILKESNKQELVESQQGKSARESSSVFLRSHSSNSKENIKAHCQLREKEIINESPNTTMDRIAKTIYDELKKDDHRGPIGKVPTIATIKKHYLTPGITGGRGKNPGFKGKK